MQLLMNNTLSECKKGEIKGSSQLSKSKPFSFLMNPLFQALRSGKNNNCAFLHGQ